MYSKVLKRIASFENGIADKMKNISDELKRKLQPNKLDTLSNDFSNNRFWIRQLEDVRTKMACRNYGLRNIIRERLKPYIGSLNRDEYECFLGDESKDLIDRAWKMNNF